MLLKRTAEEVLRDAMQIIADNTPITNFKPGSIARALVEALKDEIPALYDYAEEVLNMGFLSRAEGEYLDLIGQLFNYPRRMETTYDENTEEITEQPIDDDTYRYEISQRVLTAANANFEALRLAALAVPGVQDVIGKEYSHGTGSFSFYVVPGNGFTPTEVKSAVDEALSVRAYGIRPNVILPIDLPIDLKIQLVFDEGTSIEDRESIRFNVKNGLMNYFGNFDMGQGFIYNDLVQEIMNTDDHIKDFTVLQFYINHEPALLTNHEILDDERLTLSSIEVI